MNRSTGWIAQGTLRIHAIGILLVASFLSNSAIAIPQTAPEANQGSSAVGDEISTVLQEGYRLEAAKQWQQAIQHYEQIGRAHV